MRRFLSILVIALLGFPSLALMLTGNEDGRLPACCRRHGRHHCAMAGEAAPSGSTSLRAPSTCPRYPTSPRATFVRAFALAPTAAEFSLSWNHAAVPLIQNTEPRSASVRVRSDRGPPSSAQA